MNTESGGATLARELTFGEKAVGLTFNPSGDAAVQEIKVTYAKIIDILNDKRTEANIATGAAAESVAWYTEAIRQAQSAQMWAVKAVTYKF